MHLTFLKKSKKMTKTHGKVWNRYGKIFKMIIANFTFWATPVFSSIMYSCFYTVKHDVGNRNLGFLWSKASGKCQEVRQ